MMIGKVVPGRARGPTFHSGLRVGPNRPLSRDFPPADRYNLHRGWLGSSRGRCCVWVGMIGMSSELPEPLHVLAVGAHPDDVEIAIDGIGSLRNPVIRLGKA